MSPIPQRPGKKPIRRKVRTPKKQKEIRDRESVLIFEFYSKVAKIDGIPEPESGLRREMWKRQQQGKEPNEHLDLKTFLEKNGMNAEWRSATKNQAMKIAQQNLLDAASAPRSVAITKKEEVLILRKIRRFLATIEEAKNAGIT